ncbi:MAG: ABC transporter ATP-binding protein [Gracilibacteraceae bacterium]|jgi:spermidine/putrescine transport system ATP-binding protein|nr:ABC transporter ATP-binding protein [Gracilibacteraceae bacterium]
MIKKLDVCLQGIKKSYEGHTVVDSMDLSVGKGQFLSILGPSGCGKTTTLRIIGGQRQRIALARSLVLHPVVMLLDEPLGALDAQIRKQMQMELKQIQKELGQTFVYVTHDQEEAMTMSDIVAIMRGGVLEQLGTPEQVYDSPASLFVASFLGECTTILGVCLDGSGAFETPSMGRIQGRMPAGKFTGQAVLCIRPENLYLSTDVESPAQGDYHFTASVTQKIFKGFNTRIKVECRGETILSDVIGKSPLQPGDTVTISFSAQNALVLPAQA